MERLSPVLALLLRWFANQPKAPAWLAMTLLIMGRAYPAAADVVFVAPTEIVAEETGIIDFPVTVYSNGTPTPFYADLSLLPQGNTAIFTAGAGNTSGTFHWSTESGSVGSYVVYFVAVVDGSTFTWGTRLTIAPSGVTALVRGYLEWMWCSTDSYEIHFYANDQWSASMFTALVSVTNYDGCPDAPVRSRGPEPSAPLSKRIGLTPNTASTPTITCWGNFEGACGYVNCAYWEEPVRLTVQAYSLNPESDLNLGYDVPWFGEHFFTISSFTRDPKIIAPAMANGAITTPLVINVDATDPDGDPITSLSADLADLPPGNNAVFMESPNHSHGVLTWTPTVADSGDYMVHFHAANLFATTTTTLVHVQGFEVSHVPGTSPNPGFSALVWPNPLRAGSKLQFVTTMPGPVRVRVFDVRGRLLGNLFNASDVGPGTHQIPVRMDGSPNLPLRSGVYYYRVETAEGMVAGRFAVLR